MRKLLNRVTLLLLMTMSLTAVCHSAHCRTKSGKSKSVPLIIGTYTAKESKGIYRCDFNPSTGELSRPQLIAEVDNPSFMALSEDKKFLYAVSEGGNNQSSALNAFRYDANKGTLKLINRQPTYGASPCYVALAEGKAITANYTGGSYSVMGINADGSLGKATAHAIKREGRTSHVHGIFPHKKSQGIFITDLGCDLLLQIDQAGNTMSETSLKRGSGPRHLAFSKKGDKAYVLNELSGTVCVFDIEGKQPQLLQEIASDSVRGGASEDIHFSPDGKYLYASNRLKEDGISIFSVDKRTGLLEKIGYIKTGIHPRNFTLSPDGEFLIVAERDSNRIEVFSRDRRTGLLKATPYKAELSMPVFVMWGK